ncbi:hypothetical protein, partial [Frankia sp. CIT1]|uniref:hypothetical protein n=1 Tax=Frankia sp. CIT1 TaxID=2880974 RepID=UPI001EF6FCEC
MRREAEEAPVAVFYRGRRQRGEAPPGAGRPWMNFQRRPLSQAVARAKQAYRSCRYTELITVLP